MKAASRSATETPTGSARSSLPPIRLWKPALSPDLCPDTHITLAAFCGERMHEMTMGEKPISSVERWSLQLHHLLHHQIQLCSSIRPLDDVLGDHFIAASAPGLGKETVPVWWNMCISLKFALLYIFCVLSHCYDPTDH